MKNLELNKILGAFLLVAFVITFSNNFIEQFYGYSTHEDERKDIIVSTDTTEEKNNNNTTITEKVFDIPVLLASADSEAGKKVANKCTSCHSFDKGGPNRVGPNLYGVIGAPVGNKDGFKYSEAMKGKGGNWGYEELFQYLYNPKKYIPGNRMAFGGIKDDKELANLIAYLRSTHDNPPAFN
jgi:cytochrome c